MLLKFIGGIIIICISIGMGQYLAYRDKKRIDFLESFNHDIIILKSRISEREKLMDAINYVGNLSEYGCFWKLWAKKLQENNVRISFELSIREMSDRLNLTKTDIRTMLMITSVLGKTDIKSQKEHIDYVFDMIKIIINNARKE